MFRRPFLTVFVVVASIVWMACGRAAVQKNELQEISRLMDAQQTAWNRGDLEGFMQGYLVSDSLMFIGKRGLTFGHSATLANYHSGYPSREAMGRLQFTNLHLELLSDSAAFVVGKWELFRTADTLAGHYSLLWKKMSGNWVIVADHSS